MRNLIIASRNADKISQILPFFKDLPVNVLTMETAGIVGEAPESLESLELNAVQKASYVADRFDDAIVVAEDTGLFIDALGGAPGLYPKRWAGKNATTEEIMRYTLEKLHGVPPAYRTGYFQTAAVLITETPSRTTIAFKGQVHGRFLEMPRGAPMPNMPYSSIFMPDGQKKVLAEMSVRETNAVSHRGKAMRQVRTYLQNILRQA